MSPMSIGQAITSVAREAYVDEILDEAERTNSPLPVIKAVHEGLMMSAKDEPIVVRKLEPEPFKTEGSRQYHREVARRIGKVSDEAKLEIGALYERHEIPLGAIAREFGLHNSHLTAIARELKLTTRRRGNSDAQPGRFEQQGGHRVWVPDVVVEAQAPAVMPTNAPEPEPEPSVPPQVEQALENMLKLPARPEPRAKPTPRQPRFEVTVHGTFTVSAPDIMSAMQDLIRQYPSLRITAIREA